MTKRRRRSNQRGCISRWKVKDEKTGKWVEKDKHGLAKNEHTYNIVLSLGKKENGKPKQQSVRFHGTHKEAQQKLTELTGQFDRGELVEPSKQLVSEYLDEWMTVSVKPLVRRTHMFSMRASSRTISNRPSVTCCYSN